jgi:hypothetical protein
VYGVGDGAGDEAEKVAGARVFVDTAMRRADTSSAGEDE